MIITSDNWFTHNLHSRIDNKHVHFSLQMDLSSLDSNISFDQAVDNAITDIASKYSNLFLAFSGGMDSEFVLRSFHKRGVPITPIVVCCGNEQENLKAYEVINELGIDYHLIEVKEKDFFKRFLQVSILLNGCNHNSIQSMIAAEYVREQRGVLVTGENFIVGDQSMSINEEEFLNVLEGPFYNDVINSDVPIIHFFLYSATLAFSMIASADGNTDWMSHKSKIYNIPFRKKIRAKYSDSLTKKVMDINKGRDSPPKSKFSMSKEQVDKILRKDTI